LVVVVVAELTQQCANRQISIVKLHSACKCFACVQEKMDTVSKPRFTPEQVAHCKSIESLIRGHIVRHLGHMSDVAVYGSQALNRHLPCRQILGTDPRDWDIVCERPLERAKEFAQLLAFDMQPFQTRFMVQQRHKADSFEIVAVCGLGPSAGAVIGNLIDCSAIGPEHLLSETVVMDVDGYMLRFLSRANLIDNLVAELSMPLAQHRWNKVLCMLGRFCVVDSSLLPYLVEKHAAEWWIGELTEQVSALVNVVYNPLSEMEQLQQELEATRKELEAVKVSYDTCKNELDDLKVKCVALEDAKREALLEVKRERQHAREHQVQLLKKLKDQKRELDDFRSMCETMTQKLALLQREGGGFDQNLLLAYSILSVVSMKGSEKSSAEELLQKSAELVNRAEQKSARSCLLVQLVSDTDRLLSKKKEEEPTTPKTEVTRILKERLLAAFARDGLDQSEAQEVMAFVTTNNRIYNNAYYDFSEGSPFYDTIEGMLLSGVFGSADDWRRFVVQMSMDMCGIPPGMIMLDQKSINEILTKPAAQETCLSFTSSSREWDAFVMSHGRDSDGFDEFRASLPFHRPGGPGDKATAHIDPQIRESFGIPPDVQTRITLIPTNETVRMLMVRIKTQQSVTEDLMKRVQTVEGLLKLFAVRLYRLGDHGDCIQFLSPVLTESDHRARRDMMKKKDQNQKKFKNCS
jgi:hypothetical protein